MEAAIEKTSEDSLDQRYRFIFLFLATVSIIRVFFDWLLIYKRGLHWITFFASFHMFIYIFLLYLAIPGIALKILQAFSKKDFSREHLNGFYYSTTFIWICYPMVPIITWLMNGKYAIPVSFFEHLPFFMTTRNYFPQGMIAVIPFILFIYSNLFKKHLDISFFKSFAAVLVSTIILYLLFYQYFLRAGYYIWDISNFFLFIGPYILVTLLIEFLFTAIFNSAFYKDNRFTTSLFKIKISLGVIAIVYGATLFIRSRYF